MGHSKWDIPPKKDDRLFDEFVLDFFHHVFGLGADTTGILDDDNIADPANIDHGGLDGLGDDDHTQYALLAGRSGGQVLFGGTNTGNDLLFHSTSSGTLGHIAFTSLQNGLIWDGEKKALSIGGDEHSMTVGGVTKDHSFTTHSTGGSNAYDIVFHRHSSTSGSFLAGTRSRGSEASPKIIQDGDGVLCFFGIGYDGTGYQFATSIEFQIDGTPGTGDMPGRILFSTTPDGSGTPIERMRISSNGDFDFQENIIKNFGQIAMKSAVEATISSGEITITEGHIKVDTEGDAANDDLDTINSTQSGEILFLLPDNDDRTVRIRHAIGNIFLKHQVASQSYNFNSPQGSSGTFYVGGEYHFTTDDANLNETSPTTATHGTADIAYGAHASLIAGGAGSTDAGTVSIVVSGTSIDDEGNRIAADSETIVADITAMSLNEYFETIKKWLGTITYTITGAGGAATFNADFNYGHAKYEDVGNSDFSVTFLECVGRAGATDTGFNIRLFHHNAADWTYAATGFVPGPSAGDATELANMNTDYSTEQDLVNRAHFAYKRVDLNQDVSGNNGEGIIVEITTTANRAVESMDVHVGFHSAPNFAYLSTTKQHLIFMKHGPNFLEL